MPQPVSYNPGTPVSGSIQENNISYVVDGQQRNYRAGFGGLSWMSEVPAENNVIFIGNSTSLGRGPAGKPLFYPSYNNTEANIVYAVNTLPGSPRNFTTTGSAYNWAVTNNFFINNSNNPIPRIDADGLVLYVDANQPSSYPQTGTSWYDLSGTGYNSTLTNSPTFDSSGWLVFDGVDDYSIGNGALGPDCTCEIWISSSNYGSKIPISIDGDNYSSGPNIYFECGNINWNTGDGCSNPFSNSSYPNAQWHHIVVTNDYNVTAKLYIDGKLIGTANPLDATTTFGSNKFWIGRFHGGGYNIASLINTSRIYNTALTEAQVKQNYFQGNIVTSSLSYLWDANNLVSYGRSGTNVYNLTGSISGSMTNGTGYTYNNGGSWVFDGVDDYILLENSLTSITPGNGNWTLSAWVKGPWSSGTLYPVVGNTSGGPVASGFAIYQNKIFYQNYDGNWNYHSGNTTLNTNTWYHVTWVNYEGASPGLGTMKMYVNGVVDSSTFNSYVTNGGPVNAIGAAYNGIYSGNIASVQWNIGTAFSDQQVAQQYEATKDKFQGQQIVTNGLVLNLDAANKDSYPGTGTTWTNVATNAYNGTLYNGTSFRPNQNGGTIILDGVDDYVASSVNSALGNVATVVMLCYGTPSATDRMYCSFGGYDVYYYGGTNSRSLVFNTGGGDGYGCTGISDATISGLNMYTFVFRTDVSYSNNQIWINTTQQSISQQFGTENPGLRTFTIGNFHIGGWVYGGYYPNIGVVDTLVYNRQLSSAEITQNYNAFKAKFGF